MNPQKLKSEFLTGRLFLREWKNAIFVLSQRGGLTAEKKSLQQLLDIEILLGSVNVDPKHRVLLDNDQNKKF